MPIGLLAMKLKTGDKAFFDTFNGLIPCRVTAISGTSGIASTAQRVQFTVTETKSGYRKGEQFERSGLHVVPASALRRTAVRFMVGVYAVEVD